MRTNSERDPQRSAAEPAALAWLGIAQYPHKADVVGATGYVFDRSASGVSYWDFLLLLRAWVG